MLRTESRDHTDSGIVGDYIFQKEKANCRLGERSERSKNKSDFRENRTANTQNMQNLFSVREATNSKCVGACPALGGVKAMCEALASCFLDALVLFEASDSTRPSRLSSSVNHLRLHMRC